MTIVTQKPLAVLSVPMAVLGLLSVACVGPREPRPTNATPASETFDANETGISTVVPTSPIPPRYRCLNGEIVQSPDKCPRPSTESTAATEPGYPAGGLIRDRYGDIFDPDVTCFQQTGFSEEVSTRSAKTMLPSLIELFIELDLNQSRALAVAFSLCDVMLAETETLLQEGALGRQYRELIAALSAGSYMDFRQIYKRQPCILAVMELEAHIESDTRLVRLISAAETAALINFQPTDEELNTLTLQSLGDILSTFDELLNPDGQVEEPLILEGIVTCEQFEQASRN